MIILHICWDWKNNDCCGALLCFVLCLTCRLIHCGGLTIHTGHTLNYCWTCCLQNSDKLFKLLLSCQQANAIDSPLADVDSGALWPSNTSSTSLKMMIKVGCMIWLWKCNPKLINCHNNAPVAWLWGKVCGVSLGLSVQEVNIKKSKVEQLCTLGKRASVNQSSNLSSTDSVRAEMLVAIILLFVNPSSF